MTNDEQTAPREPRAPADDESTKGTFYAGLTGIQERGIIALLTEPTIVRAATTIGVDERTIRRWLEDSVFKRAYHAARREAFDQAIGLMQRYAPVAVNALTKIVNDAKASAAARIAAATALLRFGRDGIELDDLAQRLEALEGATQEQDVRRTAMGTRQ